MTVIPFKQNKLYKAGLVAKAEALSERIARVAEVLDRAGWALDSALSGLRKDEAGYRTANAANPDGGSNGDLEDLEAALKLASDLLKSRILPSPRDLRYAEAQLATHNDNAATA